MKKFVTVFALALVVVLTVGVLAACGGIKFSGDIDKDKATLEDKGFTVAKQGNMLMGSKGTETSGESYFITYYDSEEEAEAGYEEAKEEAELTEAMGADVSVTRDGKMVIMHAEM